MSNGFADWLGGLSVRDKLAIIGPERGTVQMRLRLKRRWQSLGCPSAPAPSAATATPVPTMRRPTHRQPSATRPPADQFPHLRRYESLIESDPRAAGNFYVEHSREILGELRLVQSQEALERETKARATTGKSSDVQAFRHYARLVESGKSREASRYYAEHAAAVVAGRAAAMVAQDDDEDEDDGMRATCSHCSGSGYCGDCSGTDDGKTKCRCHVCDGKGTL